MISSTPLARNAAAVRIKLGRCAESQVGVHAPGTAKITTCRALGRSARFTSYSPVSSISRKVVSGRATPSVSIASKFRQQRFAGRDVAHARLVDVGLGDHTVLDHQRIAV